MMQCLFVMPPNIPGREQFELLEYNADGNGTVFTPLAQHAAPALIHYKFRLAGTQDHQLFQHHFTAHNRTRISDLSEPVTWRRES